MEKITECGGIQSQLYKQIVNSIFIIIYIKKGEREIDWASNS